MLRAPLRWAAALFVSTSFAALAGCSDSGDDQPTGQTGGAATNGGGGQNADGGGGTDTGGAGGTGEGGSGGSEELVWPNGMAPNNSHPWLREHHAELVRIEPRVLVLEVVNKPETEIQSIEELLPGLVAAFAEGSRYHGYSDPNAEPFLQYQIDKVVDLRDPSGAAYPDFWPPETPNGWDVGELFTEGFAPRLGYEDPDAPGEFLTMCELFERGLVNELWISAESGVRNIYENQSHVQVYDEDLEPVAGSFNDCTNGCYYDPSHRVTCSVSVRMQEINKTRGVGCGTHAAGHAQENLRFSIPYLRDNATRFYGFDLDTRFGLSSPDLYACSYDPGLCVERPAADRMVSAALWPGDPFDVAGWGAACGNVHFPANARSQYDYYSSIQALSSCEGYGLGGGPNGEDATTTFTSALTEAYEAEHGDCGGGWMVYMGQSMPGRGNQATDAEGGPMLNWWPFLFY
ncbi:MAG: hypothetical protein HOW73_16970 [Polyangiaceae bacterium]|nr:hypothetical protein [Polyangiaceae bacterium]